MNIYRGQKKKKFAKKLVISSSVFLARVRVRVRVCVCECVSECDPCTMWTFAAARATCNNNTSLPGNITYNSVRRLAVPTVVYVLGDVMQANSCNLRLLNPFTGDFFFSIDLKVFKNS